MEFVFSSEDLTATLSDLQKQALRDAEMIQDPVERWNVISKRVLTPKVSWLLHKELYEANYKGQEVAPAWIPSNEAPETNIAKMMKDNNFQTYEEFYNWSINSSEEFWNACIKELAIKFDEPYTTVFDMSRGVQHIEYLPNAKLNIASAW
jgi:hypothetical protein